jgi:NTE family protein
LNGRRDAARWMLGAGLVAAQGPLRAAAPGASAPPATPPPRRAPAEPAGRVLRTPRLGLALGGGSARGLAHIGVLKSLEQAGIQAEVVSGSSAGALIGAFCAAGLGAWQIEEVALRTREVDVADLNPASRRGMMAGEALTRFVNGALKGARIEELKLRFGAMTTDLRNGEAVLLRSGSVADAVRASCSIPGIFVPRELGGRELVDGGLVSPLPVRSARALGADVVIAIDVAAKPTRGAMPGLYEIVLQSFEIMGRALADQEALAADLVIRPETGTVASTDFNQRKELIQAGYVATEQALPQIRKLLATPVARPVRPGAS